MKVNITRANLIAKVKVWLMHSVRLADGAKIDEARAYQFATRDGWGADNLALVATCEKYNPRPGDPLDLVTLVFSSQQWVALVLDYLLQTGALQDALKQIGLTDSEAVAMLKYQREVRTILQLREFANELQMPMEEVLLQRAAGIAQSMAATP